MSFSNLINTYLGAGLAAARPATPAVSGCAWYYATDTNTISIWNGSAWADTVASVAGTANQIVATVVGDVVTLSLPNSVGIGTGTPRGALELAGNNVRWTLNNTAGGSDEKIWDWTTDTATLTGRLINDAFSNASAWITVTRSGFASSSVEFFGTMKVDSTVSQNAVTVSALPAGASGDRHFVTDALAPTFGANVVGGGSVAVPVYHDSSSWKVG